MDLGGSSTVVEPLRRLGISQNNSSKVKLLCFLNIVSVRKLIQTVYLLDSIQAIISIYCQF